MSNIMNETTKLAGRFFIFGFEGDAFMVHQLTEYL